MPPRRGYRGKYKQVKITIQLYCYKCPRETVEFIRKKMITTRLIEISLKLDDYVYKKKPISRADALAYINEISMYKTQCLKDERSLQVIEKLTRCMKSIVEEEQNDDNYEQQQNTSTKVTAYTCLSPTYSLVEEDIDPVVHNQDIHDTKDILQKKAVAANSEQATIDTIDLCVEEDNEREYTEFNIDVEMHRAISNLSISDQNLFNATYVCSQSILENFELHNPGNSSNFEDCDHEYHNSTEKTQMSLHPALTLTTSTVTPPYKDGFVPDLTKSKEKKNEICFISIDKNSKNNPEFIDLTRDENPCKKKKESVKKVVQFETNINKEINNGAAAKDHDKNVTKKITRKRNKNSKSKVKNQNNIENKKKPRRQVKQKKINKQINSISEDIILPKAKAKFNSPNPNSTFSTKMDTANTSHGKNYDTMSKSYNTQEVMPILNEVQRAKKHCVSIYSNNTENDLSWVENIRFIREIEEEEMDTKLSGLDDSFWEDLSYPNKWDEHEFDV